MADSRSVREQGILSERLILKFFVQFFVSKDEHWFDLRGIKNHKQRMEIFPLNVE